MKDRRPTTPFCHTFTEELKGKVREKMKRKKKEKKKRKNRENHLSSRLGGNECDPRATPNLSFFFYTVKRRKRK